MTPIYTVWKLTPQVPILHAFSHWIFAQHCRIAHNYLSPGSLAHVWYACDVRARLHSLHLTLSRSSTLSPIDHTWPLGARQSLLSSHWLRSTVDFGLGAQTAELAFCSSPGHRMTAGERFCNVSCTCVLIFKLFKKK